MSGINDKRMAKLKVWIKGLVVGIIAAIVTNWLVYWFLAGSGTHTAYCAPGVGILAAIMTVTTRAQRPEQNGKALSWYARIAIGAVVGVVVAVASVVLAAWTGSESIILMIPLCAPGAGVLGALITISALAQSPPKAPSAARSATDDPD